jgi:hypothetical protein
MPPPEFQRVMADGYAFEGASVLLGAPLLDGKVAARRPGWQPKPSLQAIPDGILIA